MGNFGANFTKKQSVKTADFVVIFKANFTRNRSVCAEQTSIFNVFLTEVIIFQQQYTPEMNQWQSL